MKPSLSKSLAFLLPAFATTSVAEAQPLPACSSALITRHTECPPDTICCALGEELPEPIDGTDVVLRRLGLANAWASPRRCREAG